MIIQLKDHESEAISLALKLSNIIQNMISEILSESGKMKTAALGKSDPSIVSSQNEAKLKGCASIIVRELLYFSLLSKIRAAGMVNNDNWSRNG